MIPLPYLTKPAYGANSPCNGCGLCCAVELCELADEVFPNAQAPCPALEYEHGRAWCGMIRRPAHYLGLDAKHNDTLVDFTMQCIPIGKGCGMKDDFTVVILPAANALGGFSPNPVVSDGSG